MAPRSSFIEQRAAARIEELEAQLAAERAARQVDQQALAAERAQRQSLLEEQSRLRQAYEAVRVELALLKRRLFVAKAERVDTRQLELEFADKLKELSALTGLMPPEPPELSEGEDEGDEGAAEGAGGGARTKRRSGGRRNLREVDLPEERVEIIDPLLEGECERAGFEERPQLSWRKAGWVRVIVARVKYRSDTGVHLAPLPPSLIPKSIAGPSVWAAIVHSKLGEGMPYYRQEERTKRYGVEIDRGTMCRWQEELGAVCGATVLHAMREEAMAQAFCIAADGTGVLVQPISENDQARQPCRRGTYLVQIADADHIFFEYLPRETSEAVGELFRGYSGHVLVDAKSVYDFLFRPPDRQRQLLSEDEPSETRTEVGCWSHARRHVWEAAIITADARAREALARIGQLFGIERQLKKLSATERARERQRQMAPLLRDFFSWAAQQYEQVRHQRGLVRSAFGYLTRQTAALQRFVTDGRLPMTNNQSERELRRIATGRKAWLFVGSDDHAQAAGNLLSLIASARLHGLDPEQYLAELFRVLPQWPQGRYLELAPKYWCVTRARLIPAELAKPVGWLTIPPAQ